MIDRSASNHERTLDDNDWFVGGRLALNDNDDTSVLDGAIVNGTGALTQIVAERHSGNVLIIEAEARLLIDIDSQNPMPDGVRRDSFITIRLAKYL